MKKIWIIVVSAVLVVAITVTCVFMFANKKPEELPGKEVILDVTMSKGLDVLGTVSIVDLSKVTYKFRYLNSVADDEVSMWRLGQWGTKYPIAEYAEEFQDGDNYVLKDPTKEVIVNPKTGQYSLNCFAELEYDTPKPYGDAWLHLITIQNLADISRVSEMKNIYADLDFSIDFCENLMGNTFNPDLHTALFQWVFVVTNVNPDSPDYKQYCWMNIPYYDGRGLTIDSWKTFDEYTIFDHGKEDKSDAFIYSVSSDEYLGENGIELGKRYRITLDLIPYIEKALNSIQTLDQNLNNDYPVLLNTTLDDLMITQFYIGWEVPGTFNAGCTIYKNSLKYNKY